MNGLKHILVVDDDPEMTLLLRDFLSRQGYKVSTAGSAIDALKLLPPQSGAYPDAVVSDVRMSPLDGIDLLKRLKTERPGIPVILFSAFGDSVSAKEALARGASNYLHKPFPLGAMATAIASALKKP